MKKHYETHVEDTDKLISVAGPVLDYKSWYEQYRKLMEEQAQRKYGLYTPTSEGDDDDFPSITGMIARYSALGLTNEQMAANPLWIDKTGNGHDIQLKNFSWKGMSGVGGYVVDIDEWGTNSTAAYFERNSIKITATFKENVSLGLLYHNIKLRQSCVLKVTGIPKGCDAFLDDRLGNRFYMSEDGVYEIIPSNFLAEALYLSIEKYPERWYGSKLTIEQLPLYPGALVFDGVDDYGVCDNFPILTKEKGYTVVALRQWLSFQDIGYPTLVVNSTDRLAAFSFEDFRSKTKSTWNWGRSVGLSDYEIPLLYTYQTSTSYNSKTIYAGATEEGSNILQVCRSGSYCANAAIWEIVILDHDATEEELTKIKDYFVKTYPWLFPDQAWTVTGKTNEDEDRATIANITGNGNDLVLSNFGFAEGSGYGLYAYNFNSFKLRDNVVKPTDVKKDSFRIIGIGDNGNVLVLSNTSNSAAWKIRITGMKEGDSCIVGNANKSGDYIKIIKDGIYTFQKQYAATSINGIWYNSSQEVDVLVEQIPEYEGYLITDGVDDKVQSSSFTMNEDWTIVGDWELLSNVQINCGIVKAQNVYLYNTANGLLISINNPRSLQSFGTKSLHAICSDGRLYDRNWVEYEYTVDQNFEIVESSLNIGFNLNNYTQIAFKNLGIYNDQILSKDDCIKAYNYLQTLKSK
jgi:hypothetical protein